MSPQPAQIKAARIKAGLTQTQAAKLVGWGHYDMWSRCERGTAQMPLYRWELFLFKIGGKT